MKIKIITKNIIYAIKSLFYKKDDSIIVCGSWFGTKFADNPRFLFQYLSDNKEELGLSHVVWVSYDKELCNEINKMGYEAYLMDSEESIYFHKHAKYQICNNFPLTYEKFKGELVKGYSFRSKRINLWHGTGAIKTFNMASNEYLEKVKRHPYLYAIKNFIYSHSSVYRKIFDGEGGWGDCYFLTTSRTEKDKFNKCYPLPDSRFIVSNYPRNITNFPYLGVEKDVLKIVSSYKYTILYLPTFRDKNSSFDFSSVAASLKDTLKEKGILFIQKAHSAMANAEKKDNSVVDNVLNLDPNFDVNIITPKISCVMTDYSSIFADALYHHKPILLYMPDYDDYMNGERGFSEDAELLLSAGKKFVDIQSLNDYLQNNIETINDDKTYNYLEIRSRIWECDKSMDEIWNDILTKTTR